MYLASAYCKLTQHMHCITNCQMLELMSSTELGVKSCQCPGCSLGIGDWIILRLLCIILWQMFIHLSLTILYSDVECLSKYSPVTLHLSPATGIFIENRECYLKKKTSQQQFPSSILLSTISLSFPLLMPTSVFVWYVHVPL